MQINWYSRSNICSYIVKIGICTAFTYNNEESIIESEFIKLLAYDGYADPTVSVSVESSFTDNKKFSFNYNWSVNMRYDARRCDVSKVFNHREIFK